MTTATSRPWVILWSMCWALLFACLGPALGAYLTALVLTWRWKCPAPHVATAARHNYEPFVTSCLPALPASPASGALAFLVIDLRREASCLPGRFSEAAARQLMHQAADALAAMRRDS